LRHAHFWATTSKQIENEVNPARLCARGLRQPEYVRQSLRRIEASPFIPNKSSVRGFVYDVKSGRLNEVRAKVGAR
jgi:carbonic anhydrase